MTTRHELDALFQALDEHEEMAAAGEYPLSTSDGQKTVLRALKVLIEETLCGEILTADMPPVVQEQTDLRRRAMALYRPPFSTEYGYIFDANAETVSDDQDPEKDERYRQVISHVRGWGRLAHMVNPEALQDEVAAVIAEALTEFWARHAGQS